MDEYVGIVSNDPMDYVKIALSLEMLAYHNKNYLDSVMCCDAKRSVEIQYLLKTAIEKAEERKKEGRAHSAVLENGKKVITDEYKL